MELAHRLCQGQVHSEGDDESQGLSDDPDEPMDIDHVQTKTCSDKNKVKKLLKMIVGIL